MSNNLYKLVQSIIHQLTYLFEVHESFSFQSLSSLIKSLEKLFDYRFDRVLNSDDSSCKNEEKFVIIIDRIDRIFDNDNSNINNTLANNIAANASQASNSISPNTNVNTNTLLNATTNSMNNDYDNTSDDKQLNNLINVLLMLLKKYKNNFKLIFTISTNNFKKSKLNHLLKGVVNDACFIHVQQSKEQQSTKTIYSKKLKQHLNDIYQQFNDYFNNNYMVNYLFECLLNTNYGLKETEILDLLYIASINSKKFAADSTQTSNSQQQTSKSTTTTTSINRFKFETKSLTQLSPIVWYVFKYLVIRQKPNKHNLFGSYIDNYQLYYKFKDINIKYMFSQLLTNMDSSKKHICNHLCYNYFNLVDLSKQSYQTTPSHKNSVSISNSNSKKKSIDQSDITVQLFDYKRALINDDSKLLLYRKYQELSQFDYLMQKYDQQNTNKRLGTEDNLCQNEYLRRYVINFDWLFEKLRLTNNIWQYIDDVDYYKKHTFVVKQLSTPTLNQPRGRPSIVSLVSPTSRDEFEFFENCFFKIIYQLHNDIYQIYVQFYYSLLKQNSKMSSINNNSGSNTRITKLIDKYALISEFLNKSKQYLSTNFNFYPLKHYFFNEFCGCGGGSGSDMSCQQLIISKYDENCVLTQIQFVKNLETYSLSLSKTRNEIKIWNINNLTVVRHIKLDKQPKDIRLIDSYKAILLCDRNLHLFDINKYAHLADLKTTLNPSMPFFELHNENYLVFLDRNRLSVTLMRIPWAQQQQQQQPVTPPPPSSTTDTSLQQQSSVSTTTTTTGAATTTTNESQPQIPQPERPRQFKVGEDRYMNSLMVSKNGKIMVCGDQVQKPFPLIVWNLCEQKLIHDFRQEKHEFITTIQSISSSGRYVICACRLENDTKNHLVTYDLNTGTLYKKFDADENYVCVEISEEYNIVIGSLVNGHIIIYDLLTGSIKYTLKNCKYPANKLRIVQSQKFLSYDTTGYDWTIRLWDFSRGILLCSYTCPSLILSCDINSKGDTVIVSLYGYDELFVLKLHSMESLINQQLQDESSSPTQKRKLVDTNTPIYGDQINESNKIVEIKIS